MLLTNNKINVMFAETAPTREHTSYEVYMLSTLYISHINIIFSYPYHILILPLLTRIQEQRACYHLIDFERLEACFLPIRIYSIKNLIVISYPVKLLYSKFLLFPFTSPSRSLFHDHLFLYSIETVTCIRLR